jgi:hypothetical protein
MKDPPTLKKKEKEPNNPTNPLPYFESQRKRKKVWVLLFFVFFFKVSFRVFGGI